MNGAGFKLGQLLHTSLVLYSMTHVLQWNIRGYRANHTELQTLLALKTPAVVALQETKLKHDYICQQLHYKTFRHDIQSPTIAHGGVALLVHFSVPSYSFRLRTSIQAVAATVDFGQHKATIVYVYLPPSEAFPEEALNNLIQQLPANYILLGDFNAHHTMWGCPRT
ncbi:MAG: endonuclease/exonuclease/phosphatase family protein, partial [Myxococcota bacterium]